MEWFLISIPSVPLINVVATYPMRETEDSIHRPYAMTWVIMKIPQAPLTNVLSQQHRFW